jgi:hypothetical protein
VTRSLELFLAMVGIGVMLYSCEKREIDMKSSFKPDPEEMYLRRISNAPVSVQQLFETIKSHFQQRNDSFPHHTRTNGGDLRLAIPGEILGRKRLRNFGTLSWRPRQMLVQGRTYLSSDEMMSHDIRNTAKPEKQREPLLSDFWLQEGEYQGATNNIIKVLETARSKMMAEYGVNG